MNHQADGRDAAARNIICTKWGTKFGAEDVNRLYRMVARYMPPPYRFVCFTDDASGFQEGIEAYPLPEVPVVGHRQDHGWKKLGVFAAGAGDLVGPTLYLDLDVAITADLMPFFELPGAFYVIRDYRPVRVRNHYTGNTSVFRFEAGAHPDILDEVAAMGERVMRDFRNEQEVISWYMQERGLLEYWPAQWCPSFKHDCVYPMPLGLLMPPRLPDEARVVIFHGRPKPEDAVRGWVGSKWYRVIRPSPWLADYLA